jgi:hypothetical protein
MHDEMDRRLRKGLYRWRDLKLQKIAIDLEEVRDDFRSASEDLAIAVRNPGEVAEDVVDYLWEELNNSAIERTRLETEHERMMSLTLPQLLVEFSRRRSEVGWGLKTYSA